MSDMDDLDLTARLVLMDRPGISFGDFVEAVRAHRHAFLMDLQKAYARYCGWDGRVMPTHDIETGLPK